MRDSADASAASPDAAPARCPLNLTECGIDCVDTDSNPLHCGECNTECPTNTLCSGGSCVDACEVGKLECGGGCVDPSTSRSYCGASGDCMGTNAGVTCADTEACEAGLCTCVESLCAGECVNLSTDPQNCGGCGRVCPSGMCSQSDCVRRVFLTSATFTYDLGGLSGADQKCQTHAEAAGLGGSYKAWLSSSTQGPAQRFSKSAAPYATTAGDTVANNWSQLAGGVLSSSIDRDELGQEAAILGPSSCAPAPVFWSNTTPAGEPYSSDLSCGNWTSGPALLGLGSIGNAPAGAALDIHCNALCNQRAHLLCVEQ